MEIRITIDDRKFLFILAVIVAVSAIGVVVAYGGSSPQVMGHSWGEIACTGCINTENLNDSSVTTAKIADSSVTDAKIAGISAGKVSGKVQSATNADSATNAGNADTLDGYHYNQIGLGASVPASDSGCGIATTPSNLVFIQNNRIAVQYYGDNCATVSCGSGTSYRRYYFGPGDWSGCTSQQIWCTGGCPPG